MTFFAKIPKMFIVKLTLLFLFEAYKGKQFGFLGSFGEREVTEDLVLVLELEVPLNVTFLLLPLPHSPVAPFSMTQMLLPCYCVCVGWGGGAEKRHGNSFKKIEELRPCHRGI